MAADPGRDRPQRLHTAGLLIDGRARLSLADSRMTIGGAEVEESRRPDPTPFADP